jgi:hypothetical protein
MRPGVLFVWAAALAATAGAALARPGGVISHADMRSGPGANHPVIANVPAGAAVEIVASGRRWSRVSHEGRRGYVATAGLAEADAAVPPAYDPSSDPACDHGYPYSGSGAYFTGLTELRHTGPLGFFLGWHRRWPC